MLKKTFLLFLLLTSCTSYKQVVKEKNIETKKWITCQRLECEAPVIDKKITLEEAIEIALRYNKQLKITKEEKNIAKGLYMSAFSRYFPTLSLNADYIHLDKAPYVISDSGKTNVGNIDNYSINLNLMQPIFHGGAIHSRAQMATLNKYFSQEQIKDRIEKTIFFTKRAYYAILLARKLYLVNKQALISAKSHLLEVQNKLDQGYSSEFDKLRAEVEVTNFNAAVISQQNRVKIDKANLYKILGVSQMSDLKIVEDLSYTDHIINPGKALEVAFQNRKDLMMSELALNMQKQKIKIVQSQYFPKINFIYSNKWGKPDPNISTIDKWGRKWFANINLSLDLFDSARRRGEVYKEKSILKQRRYQTDQIRDSISLEIKTALTSLEDSKELILSQKKDLARAQEGLKLAKIGYEEGIRKEIEVTDAISSMTRSKTLYYRAIYEYNISKADLDLALGIINKKG